ncbi:MAG: glycine--tRNA ligase subunit beta [Paracoccaceae bacterium]
MPDLLLELFSEEIPARMQARAAEDLRAMITDRLVEAGLVYEGAGAFAGPRRLTLTVTGLPARSPDRREERKGPRTDAPEKALDGFLRSTGLAKEALEIRDDKKGQVYFAVLERPGRSAAETVAAAVQETVRGFPWPQSMRAATGSQRSVRPLRAILCILTDEAGTEIVPLEIDGIRASDETRGHRVHAPEAIRVANFEAYREALLDAHVILDAEARAERIWHDATQAAFARGLELIEDKGLLAEVSGLVEWPVVLIGEIGPDFLDLPPEVLQTSMREHQKFFSVRNPGTGRIEHFVTVANLAAADGGAAILAGNRRVLAARLSDAKFFWENDLRTVREIGLEGMAARLGAVTFHAQLGSQADRVARIAALAAEIAPDVGAKPDLAAEAARIAKADLASEMVYEFPELQGVMGRYYAEAAGHDDGVPEACEAHYRPLGPSDAVPTAPVSVAVALADKIDMLAGFWAIDEKPTGSRDPFALRRAALGVIRLLLEGRHRLGLDALIRRALRAADPAEPTAVTADLLGFFADRLKVVLREDGVRHDVIDACFGLGGQDDLVLLVARVRALQGFLETEDGANLLAGYRRAANIVASEEKKDGVAYEGEPQVKFAEHDAERALFAGLDTAEPAIAAALGAEDFAAAMVEMAKLRPAVDAFFQDVLVNAENQIVRRNRLCLLTRVVQAMRPVARWEAIEG